MPDMEGKPGGGITPPGGGGAGAPRTDPNLAADLKAMTALADNSRALTGMAETLARMERIVRESNKDYKDQGDSLRRILRDTSDLEFASIRIQKLEKSRGVALGATRTATAAYIKDLQREYTILLNTLNTGKGAKKHVDDIQKSLKQLDAALQRTERQSTATWDATAIQAVNAEIRATAKSVAMLRQNITQVQTKGMIDGFKGVGKAIDDAFDNQFLSKLNRMPGIAGAMRGLKFSSQARDAQARIVKHRTEHVAHNQSVYAARAAEVKKQYGPMGVKRLREMGYAGQVGRGNYKNPEGGVNRHRVALGRATTPGGGTSAVARAASAMDAMSVKSMTVGQLIFGGGKKTGAPGAEGGGVAPLAAEAAATKAARRRHSKTGRFMGKGDFESEPGDAEGFIGPRLEPGDKKRRLGRIAQMRAGIRPDVTLDDVRGKMTGDSGGMFSQALNHIADKGNRGEGGMMGSLMAKLAAKGGGSVMTGVAEGAAGAASGVAGTALGIASKAALPLAIGKALLELRDKVAMENKEIDQAMASTGIHGEELGTHQFEGIRKTMLSTGLGAAAMMGQGKEQNMKILSTLGEGGWATGRSTNKAGGVDLGEALGTGNGFYGAIMKNSVYNGRNMGFSQDTSVKLTMKLMEKFGKTTEATQDFFVHLDTMMHSTGISAGKYLEVIDAVTDQFDDLNKSLGATVDIMTNLGKSGRLTGDQIKDIMTGITKPTQTTTAQKIAITRNMSPEDMKRAAGSEQAIAGEQLSELNQQLQKYGISGLDENLSNLGDVRNAVDKLHGEDRTSMLTALEPGVTRYTRSRARAGAYARGDAGLIAAQQDLMPDAEGSTTMRAEGFKRILETAGIKRGSTEEKKLLGGDAAALQALYGNTKVLTVLNQEMQQGTWMSSEDFNKYVTATGRAGTTGAGVAMDISQKDVEKMSGPEKLALAQLYKGLHPDDVHGTKTQKDIDALATAFKAEARGKGAGSMRQALSSLPLMIDMMTHMGTTLAEAQKVKETREGKEKMAKENAAQTRTSAEIFASAFEYLFTRITTLLDKLGNFMGELWHGSWASAGAKNDADKVLNANTFDAMGAKFQHDDLSPADQVKHDKIKQRRDNNWVGADGVTVDFSKRGNDLEQMARWADEGSGGGTKLLRAAQAYSKANGGSPDRMKSYDPMNPGAAPVTAAPAPSGPGTPQAAGPSATATTMFDQMKKNHNAPAAAASNWFGPPPPPPQTALDRLLYPGDTYNFFQGHALTLTTPTPGLGERIKPAQSQTVQNQKVQTQKGPG